MCTTEEGKLRLHCLGPWITGKGFSSVGNKKFHVPHLNKEEVGLFSVNSFNKYRIYNRKSKLIISQIFSYHGPSSTMVL